VTRIRSRLPPTPEELEADYDLQDIVSVNLERAVQVSVDLALHILSDGEGGAPSTMAGSFEALHRSGLLDTQLADRLRAAVGFRNISVHAYGKLDWRLVHRIATERVDDFVEFARVVERLKSRQPED